MSEIIPQPETGSLHNVVDNSPEFASTNNINSLRQFNGLHNTCYLTKRRERNRRWSEVPVIEGEREIDRAKAKQTRSEGQTPIGSGDTFSQTGQPADRLPSSPGAHLDPGGGEIRPGAPHRAIVPVSRSTQIAAKAFTLAPFLSCLLSSFSAIPNIFFGAKKAVPHD